MNDKLKIFIFKTTDDNRSLLIRIIVGLIFLTEGIQKFIFPNMLGPGRFEKIGFTDPEFWAYLTGTFEILCGTFVLLGLFSKLV